MLMPTPTQPQTPNLPRIRKFVKALRSKRFRQGYGTLHKVSWDDSNRYCCLGVACQVAIEGGLNLKVVNNGAIVGYDDSCGCLPARVRDWYGFESNNPALTFVERLHWWQRLFRKPVISKLTAVVANDSQIWDFDDIADAFERKYLK